MPGFGPVDEALLSDWTEGRDVNGTALTARPAGDRAPSARTATYRGSAEVVGQGHPAG